LTVRPLTNRSALLLAILLPLVTAGCSARPATLGSAPPDLVVPLLATEPDFARDADLRVLADWLEEATMVGVGERVHGTHELHRLSHRLFAHLADVFALEVDQAHAALLNEYVCGSRDDLEAILAKRWCAGCRGNRP
jgi:erythromycin esterase-like protein